MTQEEIEKAFKEHELDEWEWLGFNTPKKTFFTYNIIAWFENKRLKITKIINDKKCEVKIIKHRGLDINRDAISRNYNEDLEHKNGKIKIIDFEII